MMLKVLKTRLTLRDSKDEASAFRIAVDSYKKYGPKFFFRGYTVNSVGAISFVGIDLCLYEVLSFFMLLVHYNAVSLIRVMILSFSSIEY